MQTKTEALASETKALCMGIDSRATRMESRLVALAEGLGVDLTHNSTIRVGEHIGSTVVHVSSYDVSIARIRRGIKDAGFDSRPARVYLGDGYEQPLMVLFDTGD